MTEDIKEVFVYRLGERKWFSSNVYVLVDDINEFQLSSENRYCLESLALKLASMESKPFKTEEKQGCEYYRFCINYGPDRTIILKQERRDCFSVEYNPSRISLRRLSPGEIDHLEKRIMAYITRSSWYDEW